MKILVTGANGQLGLSIRKLAPSSGFDFVFTDVVELPEIETRILDITDRKAVSGIVAEEKIDAIVNCAAYTNVDKAEDEEGLAFKLNAIAPSILAQSMAEAGGLLIHISTDYVFDGKACSPLEPGMPTGPRSAYGRTKLAGEKMIEDSGCRSVIIRTAWLYSEYGKNFVKTMLRLTSEKESISVVADQVGTPTYATDLAAAILKVLSAKTNRGSNQRNKPEVEIYHYSNEGEISWHKFASSIARMAGTLKSEDNPSGCIVNPCTTEEYPSKVDRPRYSVLSKDSFVAAYGVAVPAWEDSLAICLKNLVS